MKIKINKTTCIIIAIIGLFFSTSCGNKKADSVKEEEKTEKKEGDHTGEHEDEIALTLEQYKAVQIETGTIEMRNLNAVVKANGYTSVPPQNNANASSLMGGVIQDIYVLEGTYVTKGKVLASIKNLEIIEIQEEYKTSIASIEYLELEYQRQKSLTDENVNAKKIFQEVKFMI